MKSTDALALLGAFLSCLAPSAVEAADARAGRQKITACQACHGLDGLSKNPEAPNLAGQIEGYLVKALMEYKSGTRKNESMNIVTKDLSDQDLADMAAYYSSIEIDVLPP
ncbi:c-type cytochrome [Microvirga makkahensis]|uniref:C-type cytochrome n=1 Tax=Microvirga makkahensis TaxID=1128670 RepID=A0A7X3SP16_9HYPH|nr:cytochrome c [Microvirga makkahensis]MXQ11795.1 c-type cytochrome [Microvirga makkahensis]